ncbi:MAG: mannose-1-phosphate guanylyltransferase/mannose-6-phosphate isomerase [Ectothiorhodospiraceae bacterium]|nr:mannose-1-phosphate guanylyltransferase/mannose-6-phosphate isomerase [Ectothiorhodospiraceae bacterium]
MPAITPVILSGGSGTRLWPLSREHYPKQLLPLADSDATLLQQTVQRLEGMADAATPIIVCNQEHRFLVAEQLRSLGGARPDILLEPVGRNTAPGVAVAALHLARTDPEGILLVMPSDHLIRDTAAFRRAIAAGARAAETGSLVTFGVLPTHPETGYGYIRAAQRPDDPDRAVDVAEFVEKPDLDTASGYLASGDYLWNSGIFMFQAQGYLDELEQHAPAILDASRQALEQAQADLDFLRLGQDAFAACPSDSIDYAVMEKTRRAAVVPLDAGWTDLGSWSALHEASDTDAEGNAVMGDVILRRTQNCYVRAESRLVAALGLENCIIVETPDAVLVADRGHVQDVKKVVEQLRADGRYESLNHRRVERPWGSYEGISSADRFQVKRIVVAPGRALSLQMHHHRAEHWVVVRGTGRVTRGDESFLISEDQSTYISLGTVHRLENPGVIPLELIEVQTGSYLGEDDIVRFDDQYGRN